MGTTNLRPRASKLAASEGMMSEGRLFDVAVRLSYGEANITLPKYASSQNQAEKVIE